MAVLLKLPSSPPHVKLAYDWCAKEAASYIKPQMMCLFCNPFWFLKYFFARITMYYIKSGARTWVMISISAKAPWHWKILSPKIGNGLLRFCQTRELCSCWSWCLTYCTASLCLYFYFTLPCPTSPLFLCWCNYANEMYTPFCSGEETAIDASSRQEEMFEQAKNVCSLTLSLKYSICSLILSYWIYVTKLVRIGLPSVRNKQGVGHLILPESQL